MTRLVQKSAWLRAAAVAAIAAGTVPAGTVAAATFDIGEFTTVNIDNLFTIGAAFRTQKPDERLISKSTVYQMRRRRALNDGDPSNDQPFIDRPALCVGRQGDTTSPNEPGPDTSGNNVFFGDTCTTSAANPDDPNHPNQRFVNAVGSFSPNADNQNQIFDKGDLVSAVAKLTTDYSFDIGSVSFFARTLWYFDEVYNDFELLHGDTTLQPRRTPFDGAAQKLHGNDFQLLDAYASFYVAFIGDRELSVKVGRQVLNWGESALLLLNSLNTVNPVSQPRLVTPGFDLKELLKPVGMVFLQTDLTMNASIEMFYQYEWEPLEANAPGHFNAPADILGPGGEYAMLSFGKAPEDPLGLYQPNQNPDDPIGLLDSEASRTVYRNFEEERKRRPDDGGQYGVALKFFLESFNNGTELAFYHANYHARVPSISGLAAQATCIPAPGADPLTNLLNLAAACGGSFDPVTQRLTTADEPVPVDSAQLIIEYPEDIKLYGLSFNTTLGDWALSGEYAFRENLPIQVHSTDLLFNLLQPAFPEADYDIGAAVIPGRRSAVPDFLGQYRGQAPGDVAPGSYVRGWEPMKIGQAGLTLLKTIGGDNPLGAAQIVLLLEMGYTHVLDFPDLCTELQFNGASTNTHISHGADGTAGCEPPDAVGADADDDAAQRLRQNPTAENRAKFGTAESYGYRFINLNRFDNVLFGANLETLFIARHDIEGVGPGLGQNFVEGRKQFDFGIRWDYLSRFIGEVRYTWFTGADGMNGSADKDQAFIYAGWQF